jgi:hypothetical protein
VQGYFKGRGIVTDKVLIDYFGGAHGHFLEYILNAACDDALLNSSPFGEDGTCRYRLYTPNSRRFHADHFSFLYYKKFPERILETEGPGECIAIVFEGDYSDWLLYLEVAFHRGPQSLNETVNFNSRMSGFSKLREHVLSNNKNPKIRKNLADLFLSDPTKTPYHEHQVPFLTHKHITNFKFSWFYDWQDFISGIELLAKQFDLTLSGKYDIIKERYSTFIELNPYANRNSFHCCNEILNRLDEDYPLHLNLIEEAYLCKMIERKTGVLIDTVDNSVFDTTKNLREFINEISIRY